MARLTAEQVAANFEATAVGFDLLDQSIPAAMYRDAANFVRDHLIESPDERRARFEAWFAIQNPHNSLERDGDGYYYPSADDAWQAFNAALDFRGDA